MRKIAVLTAVVMGMAAGVQAQTRLTFIGASATDWFAQGAWLDATGNATNWTSGSIAVITNREVTLNADTTAAGLEVHMTGRYCVYGTGRLTLGAGGIIQTGAGEFNIQCKGGLFLSESQAWTSPTNGMICLDGLLPFTAASNVVLTGNGGAMLRLNANGSFVSNNTVCIQSPARLSPAVGNKLGASVLILDGNGTRLSAGSVNETLTFNETTLCRLLILRNGASIDVPGRTFSVPNVRAETPTNAVTSSISGASALALGCAETELDIEPAAVLQVSIPMTNAAGVAASLKKTGAGLLSLNASSAYSGGLAVSNGWVRLAQAGGAGSGTVSLSEAAVLEIAASGTLSNVVVGAGRVVKSGSGTVTLSGANSFAGGTSLSGGVTRVSQLAVLGGGAVAVSSGASLVLTDSQALSADDRSRIIGSGTVLAGTGAEVTWGTDYAVSGDLALDAELGGIMAVGQLSGSGYTKTLPGTLRIAGTTGYSGAIVVNAGVLDIGSTANLAEGVTVQTTGSGVVQLDSLDGQDLSKITGTRAVALKDGAAVALNTDSLTVALSTVTNETWSVSTLTGSADLVKTGAGSLVVSNATGFTGRVRVHQGRLQVVGTIGSNAVIVSNGVFVAYGHGTVLQNTFTVAGGTLQADAGGSLGAGSIALLAGATVAATNSGSLGSGVLAVSAGKLRMDAGGTAGTRGLTLSGSGIVEVYDGAGFDNATLEMGGGTLDFRATTTLNIGATLVANATCQATTPAGAAEPTVATLAGAFNTSTGKKLNVGGNGRLRMAGGGLFSGNGNGEIFVVNGGDLTIVSNKVTVYGYAGLEANGKRFAIADGGTFEMAGSGKRLHAGHGSGNALFEVLSGGGFRAKTGNDVVVGVNGGTCTFRVNGGDAVVENDGSFIMGENSSASTNKVELLAGTLRTSRQIKRGTGAGSVVFKGGTLQSDGVNSYDPWIATNIPVAVEAAGGTINTAGLDMKIGSGGCVGAAALMQTGGGSLRFAYPSPDWTGGFILSNGTAIAAANGALGSGTVTLGTNTLRIAGTFLLPNGIVAASNGVVTVDLGATGTVNSVTCGKLVKGGAGALSVGLMVDDGGVSIQDGEVIMVTPSLVPAGVPAIWMDASASDSFVTVASNDVARWYDRRTPGAASGFFATNLYNRPLIVTNALNGLPVLDFGRLGQGGGSGDNRMLVFKNYQTNIRSVFWVIGSQNGGGFLLGDNQVNASARHFHRSSGSGTYGGVASDALWGGTGLDKGLVRGGETRTNGVAVNGASTGLSGGYDLVTWRLSAGDDATNATPGACWFASCYAPSDGRLNGGQRLAEVLIYTNRLTDAEIKATELYLNNKWFPSRVRSLGEVSLDGTGTGFVNAAPEAVSVSNIVINAGGVSVAGAENSVSAERVTVTATGVLDATRLPALSAGDLEMREQATLAATFDLLGALPVLRVGGDLVLPSAARYTVSSAGSALPPGRALLIAAEGSVLPLADSTVWTHVGSDSLASQVIVEKGTRTVWLNTPSGTLLWLQ